MAPLLRGQLIQGEQAQPLTPNPSPGLGDTPTSVNRGAGSHGVALLGELGPRERTTFRAFAQSRISPWSPEWLSELYLDLWAREGLSYKIIASNCNPEKL